MTLKNTYPYYLAGEAVQRREKLPVTDKYSDQVVTHVALADGAVVQQAIEAGLRAEQPMRQLAGYERQAVLRHCAQRVGQRAEELAYVLAVEAGKPIRDARGEVLRTLQTLEIAVEEAVRIGGEVVPLDRSLRTRDYRGMWQRVPVGLCSLISPFNFPLNLSVHKIGPALAAGCPFILKPASFTPVSALILGEILAETDLPPGAFSILPCPRAEADLLVTDQRIKMLSFTGSPVVGWGMKSRAGRKKVALELGGNAACIVDENTDLDDAVARLMVGIFYQSGQVCISVQRVIAHRSLYDELKRRLVGAAETLVVGDPKDEATFVGPIIADAEADRIEQWIESARARGATLLCGGARRGRMIEPTLLENVPRDENIYNCEAFGPVAVLEPFDDFDEAIRLANDSPFGLQAGVMTGDLQRALRAWDRLEVGGVIVGDVPSWRADDMPYGGVKQSGLGREGVRYALEEMTEIRMMVVRRRDRSE